MLAMWVGEKAHPCKIKILMKYTGYWDTQMKQYKKVTYVQGDEYITKVKPVKTNNRELHDSTSNGSSMKQITHIIIIWCIRVITVRRYDIN